MYYYFLLLAFLVLQWPPKESRAELLHKQFDFDWKIEGAYIIFQVAAETKGWVGLGVNEKPLMKDACMIVGGVREDRIYYYDTHGIGEMQPHVDDHQNYEVLAANENETHTSLTIRRKLDTGDPHDIVISDDPLYVLWAFANTDARNATSFDYHAHRGYALFDLLNPVSNNQSMPTLISLSVNDRTS